MMKEYQLLVNLYNNGYGVIKNYSKAMEYYQKAAEKGNDKASGNKRFISINRPAKEPNHRVLITGATERYVFISFFVILLASLVSARVALCAPSHL